ncbi:uncharacterized protein LOC119745502 [Patiria miniata]|uniref:ZMYM2-like/QRICH1 C-terminal domain-containing protein n=1 Tax=Patiria miniata TaxID=46514 RepID=A0A914BPB8_PATMI|nr:uncharacterized protein LOC119745502 [Patiria miniata]
MAASWENNEDDGSSANNGSMFDFAELWSDPEVFESFMGSTDEKVFRAMREAFMGVLADYCTNSKGAAVADVERMSPGELCQFLQEFYADVRQPDGRRYTRHSMFAMRHVLQNHFQNVLQADILNDPTFGPANDVFDAIDCEVMDISVSQHAQQAPWNAWERKKKERNVHIISKEDMDKIRSSYLTDCTSPKGLQNTVFLNVMLHFCCTTYGRWNLRDMKKSNFAVMTDGALNRRFICFVNKDKTGNLAEAHLGNRDTENGGDESDDDFSMDKVRMYEALEDPKRCPVALFEKYLAKLDPKCDVFWQRPHKYKRHDNYWYDGVAVGVNCLGYKMRDISTLAGCSMVYSNQCLKVTSRACRLRMTETGSPCTCSAQHLLPPDTSENSDSGFHGNRASFCTGSSEEENSFLSFVKDEPDDVIVLDDENDGSHEMHNDVSARSDTSPVTYVSLPSHSGHTSQSGIIYKSAVLPSPPATSNAYPIQYQDQALPDCIISVHTNDNPQAHLIEEQFRKSQDSPDFRDAWRVERSWLDDNNERRWLLTQNTENKQRKWLLSQNSGSPVEQGTSRGSADEHLPRNLPPFCQTSQNTRQNLADQVQRSNHAMPRPTTETRSGQNVDRPDSREGGKSATQAPQDAPAASGGRSGITTMMTADSEVLELQKEVLRMQRANLALERRKMELQISKLEAETLRMRGGS